jgi:DNA polymerase
MPKIHLDFETRSEADIWRCGAWAYAEHPSTRILCLAYAVDSEPPVLVTGGDIYGADILGDIQAVKFLKDAAEDERYVFFAHNAFFEQCIWECILVQRLNWGEIPTSRWACTAAASLACALPASLEKAGKALALPIVKDADGRKVMLQLCKPRKPSKNNRDVWWTEAKYPEKFKTLYEYCVRDVEVERMLEETLPELSPEETEVWRLDQKINMRGVQLDRDLIESATYVFEEYEKSLKKEIFVYTKGFLSGTSCRDKMLDWLEAQGVCLPDLTKQTVSEVLEREDLPPNVRKLLLARRSLGKTSIKKFYAMQMSMGTTDRLRDLFMYHGATTGRWSGKLVQLQNLPVGNIKDLDTAIDSVKHREVSLLRMMYNDPVDVLSSCIRGAIVSKPGHDLLVADYASIELRVLFWLAGEAQGLQKLKEGTDLYVDLAKKIYDDESLTKDKDPVKRGVGKSAVLGLGYGMGSAKFQLTCKSKGIDVEERLAEHAVRVYRKTYRSVSAFWRAQEQAAKDALRTGDLIEAGRFRWKQKGRFLLCQLPSGRKLAYPNPKIESVVGAYGSKPTLTYMGVDSKTKQYQKQKTYGAKLVENLTQAVARDLLAAAMLRLEGRGYPVVLTIHDEVGSEVPEDYGSLESFCEIMCELPYWAKGLPVVAEGFRAKRYRKEKG